MCKGTDNSDANQVFFHLFLIKITCVTATIELSVTHDADCRNTPLIISPPPLCTCAPVHQCVIWYSAWCSASLIAII